MSKLPVISLSAFDDPARAEQEQASLYEVCRDHGFFYLKDHDVSTSCIAEAMSASRGFFALPLDVKSRYDHSAQTVTPQTSRGYVPSCGETLSEADGPDPKEFFDVGLDRPLTGELFTGPTIMPDDDVAPGFAASLFRLQAEVMSKVTPRLLHAFALALNLPKTYFDPYFTDPALIQRVIYYSSRESSAGRHTDSGMFTILIQEELPAPSLRVFTKGSWIEAPPLPDTFVVNIGDMLQYYTDGLFVSTAHQVIHSLPVDRVSFPFFVYPNITAEFHSYQHNKIVNVREVIVQNFQSVWVDKTGAGRAQELA